MSKFIVTVLYKYGDFQTSVKYRARAKGIQFVKEQFHRYTHENYTSVERNEEDCHIHTVGYSSDIPLKQELENVEPVNEWELQGLNPIKKV